MTALDAILYYDLQTRDGRRAIELRRVLVLGDGLLYAKVKNTFYCCAYDTQSGRIAAFSRATTFCLENDVFILTYENAVDRRAAWL